MEVGHNPAPIGHSPLVVVDCGNDWRECVLMAFSISHRTRTLMTFGALSLAAATALAGCSQPEPAAGPSSPSSTSSTPAASPSGSPSGSPSSSPQSSATPSPSTLVATTGQCTAAMLSGSTDNTGGGAAGHLNMKLLVRNTSDKPCTMDGYPGVSLVGKGNGTQLGAAADRNPAQPSSGVITLAPGASAQAQLRYTQAGNYQNRCSQTAADGLRVYPPGATDALYIPQPLTACTEDSVVLLQIGAFTPA